MKSLKEMSDLQLSNYLVEKSKIKAEYEKKINKAMIMLEEVKKEIRAGEYEQINRVHGIGEQLKI